MLTIEIPGVSTEGTVLWFHGGFFAIGSAAASVGLAADLARHARRQVVTVDYRLAPEHPCPAALDDATAAYRALLDTGVDPGRLAVAGESAGANLAVSVLAVARHAGLPQPSAAVLMSPWVDLAGTGDTVTTKAAVDPIVTAEAIRLRAADYLTGSGIDPGDPAASPVHADLTGLPPLLIQVGSHEVLLDDAVRLAAGSPRRRRRHPRRHRRGAPRVPGIRRAPRRRRGRTHPGGDLPAVTHPTSPRELTWRPAEVNGEPPTPYRRHCPVTAGPNRSLGGPPHLWWMTRIVRRAVRQWCPRGSWVASRRP